MKSSSCLALFVAFLVSSFSGLVYANTGLEIDHPEKVNVVYTIEADDIPLETVQNIITTLACDTGIKLGLRQDAQLFVRVEQHAGMYLLYLDFNRALLYNANGKQYSTKGFVWGRYANNIDSQDELFEDLTFFAEEFFSDYRQANKLK